MREWVKILCFALSIQMTGAQKPVPDSIKLRIEEHLRASPVWVASLQLNQEEFVPGDTILFAVYLLNQAGELPQKKILLQTQIRNQSNELELRETIAVKDGVAFGRLVVPDSTVEGFYNFEIRNQFDLIDHILTSTRIKIVSQMDLEGDDQLLVFPEGGRLIEAVTNKLLLASSPHLKLQLVDDTGFKVSEIKFDSTGKTVTSFTPQPGRKYFGVLKGKKIPMPSSNSDGVALRLIESETDPATFSFLIPPGSKYHHEVIYLIAVTDGRISYTSTLTFADKDSIGVKFPVELLSSRISQLLILDSNESLLAIRNFQGMREKLEIEIMFDRPKIFQRDSITVTVKFKKPVSLPVSANFSAAIINQNVLANTSPPKPISNDLLIGMNSIFLPWEDLLKKGRDLKPIQYSSQIKLRGRAVFVESGEPLPDSSLLFFYLQKSFMGYEATTTHNGFFDLIFLFDFYGKDKLFFQAERNGEELSNVKINWEGEDRENPSEKKDVYKNVGTLHTINQYAEFKKNERLVEQSYSYFAEAGQQRIELDNPNKDFEDEFMGADIAINAADYLILPTMKDMVKEVIPYLQYRMQRGKPIVRVLLSNSDFKTKGDPLYIIDGQMTKESKFFLSIKPADVLTIKIEKDINKLSGLGLLGRNGIVYVQTKGGKAGILTAQDHYPVMGLTSSEIGLRASAKLGQRRPLFRSTVYWNPVVKTTPDGEATFIIKLFDDVGTMKLKISGITGSGQPFSEEKEFMVHFRGK